MIKKLFLPLTIIGLVSNLSARENIDMPGVKKTTSVEDAQKVMAGCQAGTTQTEIRLNNVRTRMLTSGDMWWDLSNAKYEVPKGSNSYACFAGSLWFGGRVGGQLRVSAMTYRQSGIDFWPGPLDPLSVEIDAATCAKYDKHWRFNRADVDKFYANNAAPDPYYSVPTWIKEYPGNAPIPTNQFNYLAPFTDVNNDLVYDYSSGDYPGYNVTGAPIAFGDCKKMLFGDETLFWVFNDKGNIHSETTSQSQIGVEIRAQAFEFATSDELNDMTFYNFEIINRSTNKLDSTYLAVWVDSDLGNYIDDYIGCDVKRGLGYIYNGDNYDDDQSGQTGYHAQLPALGCDFFQGPNADTSDHVDNDRDGCLDCTYDKDPLTGALTGTFTSDKVRPEQIIMSRFAYYNNTSDPKNGNPGTTGNGIHFYNLMKGLWKDGSPMTYGGNGVGGAIPCEFLYPDVTDPTGSGTGGIAQPAWTEVTAANQPGDRRFLQSAGQFTLQPGAVNYVTFGMPFVRTTTNNNFAAISLLQQADDKAQSLFDQCFKVLDGPDAPDLTIQEMENELIVFLTNKAFGNNYEQKRYHEVDVSIPSLFMDTVGVDHDTTNKFYDFEGYMVYQLKDETVSQTDLEDNNKARLIFQSDIKNGVAKLINYKVDPSLGSIPQLMNPVANDDGIKNSFTVNEDQFAEGSKKLVNHKTYYFMAVAYAYNSFLHYKQDIPPTTNSAGIIIGHPSSGDYMGQKKPFLRGRKNIRSYSAIPHNISPEANGTILNSYYGYGPKIKRIEGQGNGGNAVDLTEASINAILNSADNRMVEVEYENARGPISVKVIDPLNVCGGDFVLKMQKGVKNAQGVYQYSVGARDTSCITVGGLLRDDMRWTLAGTYKDKNGNTQSKNWTSDVSISVGQEQILTGTEGEPIGISITINKGADPQRSVLNKKGETADGDLLESSMTYSGAEWLTGVIDAEGETQRNWIRSGIQSFTTKPEYNDVAQKNGNASLFGDPGQVWENVVDGRWAPFRMVAGSQPGTGNIETAPAPFNQGFPQFSSADNQTMDTRNLASVDIVFTADKNKWTRCPVIELCHTTTSAVGAQNKFFIRKQASVDKNGVATGSAGCNETEAQLTAASGMGWFPGYAINIETGERLTVAFGENSGDVTNNGNDMMWNPTSTTMNAAGKYVFGGMHYVYVFGHNSDGVKASLPIDVARYDNGSSLQQILSQAAGSTSSAYAKLVEAYKDAMWVSLPLTKTGFTIAKPSDIPGDVKVRIRVKKPLRYAQSGVFSKTYSATGGVAAANFKLTYLDSVKDLKPANFADDILAAPVNGNFPMYTFSTWDMVTTKKDVATAKDALSLINVVPNPYYGHSAYERQRIDNYIKIVNLPPQCTIRIYTINGTLVRTLKKDTDATTDMLWDLKNGKNISIASGLYIIHIDVPGVGEKILKWFGVMRPLDLQSY